MNIELTLKSELPESQRIKYKELTLKDKAKATAVKSAPKSANSDSIQTGSTDSCASESNAKTDPADEKGYDFVGIAG